MFLPLPTPLAMNSATSSPTSDAIPSASEALREQYVRPGDVMSVLLILGADVVQRALAQLSGSPLTPVAFSFGWVTYAIGALLAAVGDNKLIPLPDSPGFVINSKSPYTRQNCSWILGRIIRDYEHWRHPKIRRMETEFLAKEGRIGLTVAIYTASRSKTAGVPDRDWLYYSGLLCAVFQLGIAAIPWAMWSDWSILMTTAIGITFAFASGSLPQWKVEKYQCRRNTDKTVILTRGNGHNNGCIVVIGDKVGLDLEDLAGGRRAEIDMTHTRVYTSIMALLWTALLIGVSGLKENPWFLLVIGVVGMIQNVIVCGAPRKPGAFGVHLEFVEAIVEKKVMKALQVLEEKYTDVGSALVDTYFPGGRLFPDEKQYWKKVDNERQAKLIAKLAKRAAQAAQASQVPQDSPDLQAPPAV
ncbi:hypothetical protein BZA05DRAFT_412470 [Tricharina praecox]|uniref:uncharacterized protein n=1 Tax=Tricharina praecox TaxID=43433 RepID=UPI002220F6B5|nr:uncharacterized protein BZA05DRAFT_412470 [Tricharina praecox]KAI5842262.1 hypothetical protein BZA05DRAFT_412470 [Tricharina praecox]